MAYEESVLDLSAPFRVVLVQPRDRVTKISITEITPGASVQCKLGRNEPFTILAEGTVRLGLRPKAYDAEYGMTIINPAAQPGARLVIIPNWSSPGEGEDDIGGGFEFEGA